MLKKIILKFIVRAVILAALTKVIAILGKILKERL